MRVVDSIVASISLCVFPCLRHQVAAAHITNACTGRELHTDKQPGGESAENTGLRVLPIVMQLDIKRPQ